MAYRLALDVGTASLGLVALGLDDQLQPSGIVYSLPIRFVANHAIG